MKIKKEYIVLAVIIVASVAYLALHRDNRTLYKLPTLSTIKNGEVNRIEISGPRGKTTLKKIKTAWFLEPSGYPADADKVRGMLATIDNLKLTALVSESKSYEIYGLDDKDKITVKAYDDDTLKREFDIGKVASTYEHTYVRFPNDFRVYHAEGNFHEKFDRSVDDFRDKTVLAFTPEDITGIVFTKDGETFDLEREAKKDEKTGKILGKPAWALKNGVPVDRETVTGLLDLLNGLECEKFIAGAKKSAFTNPELTIALKGTSPVSLSIFAKPNKTDTMQPAVSSINAYPFELAQWRIKAITDRLDKLTGKPANAEMGSPKKSEAKKPAPAHKKTARRPVKHRMAKKEHASAPAS